MSIYLELIERVDNGETFSIDFEKRNMRVGKEYLIKDGEYDASKGLFPKLYDEPYDMYVILHQIRELYRNYKHSLPSERSESKRKNTSRHLQLTS